MVSLRDIRNGKSISIERLAMAASVSTKTIVEIELGRSAPRVRTIEKICNALGVKPTDVDEFASAIYEGAETKDERRPK